MKPFVVAILLMGIIATGSSQSQEASHPLDELPACSLLRQKLDTQRGSGIEESFMAKMRQQGVKRSATEVHASYRSGRIEDIRIVRRSYFNQFDGSESQILDEHSLKKIADSGLQSELDKAVVDRVKGAQVARPIDRSASNFLLAFKHVWTVVQIYSDPFLPQRETRLYPNGRQSPLGHAAMDGDALETEEILQSGRFTQRELDEALFAAVLSEFDNTACIRLLLHAGANVNARAGGETTPLMTAVARPCNIKPLLDGGAERDARDNSGRTALETARQQKVIAAVQLLQ